MAGGLDAAHPHGVRAGEERVVERDRAFRERPGHDRAGALHGEHPVDPEPGPAGVAGFGGGREDGVED